MQSESTAQPTEGPKWTRLEASERRAMGVLIEKAKTTPDAYPLTLNSLRTGCNQKSNRFPQMQLEEHHVEEALEELRKKGAVAFIQGDGRSEKYRHLAYAWMGIDKVELAVMAELLLRGAQTIGELRGRAARMEPIKGLSELEPVLANLKSKGLLVFLSPPGRGAVVTHNLYQPREMDKVRRDHGIDSDHSDPSPQPHVASGQATAREPSPSQLAEPERPHQQQVASPTSAAVSAPHPDQTTDQAMGEIRALRRELADTRAEFEAAISELREELADFQRRVGDMG